MRQDKYKNAKLKLLSIKTNSPWLAKSNLKSLILFSVTIILIDSTSEKVYTITTYIL